MRRLIATLAAVTALAVAGCGSDKAEPAGPDTGQDPTSDSSSSSEPAAEVESVSLTRTGGIAGVQEMWKIGPSDPGHAAVFKAASQLRRDDVEGTKGKPPCCDYFEYTLVIRYSDGATESYRMYDGGTTDPALEQLVSAVLDTGPPEPTASIR